MAPFYVHSMNIVKKYLKITLLCIPAGVVVGVLCFVFTKGLRLVNGLRINNPYIFIPLLFAAGLLVVYLFEKCNVKDNNDLSIKKGMHLVFDSGHKKIEKIPLRLIAIVSISTWITNLCGGSCGREGVAVQIGAAISNNFNRTSKENAEIFTIAGMGAGFAAMFQTPLAGIAFALEVLTIRKIKYHAIVPTIIESFVAYYVAKLLHMQRDTYVVKIQEIELLVILKVVVVAIIFGFCGLAFSRMLEWGKFFYNKKVKNKYIGIAVSGIILSILFMTLHMGRYSGTGANLIDLCFENNNLTAMIYNYDFIFKFILTALTLAVGFQGGEVTPLFTIGATLGYVIGIHIGIDPSLLASLGFISVFAAATNTFLCPILIGVEVFGMHNILFYVISVFVAYVLNFDRSIYPQDR